MDCVCPMPLVGDLDLTWMQVTFFPGCAGSYHPSGGGLEMEGLKLALCEAGLSLCSAAIMTLRGAGSDPKLLEQNP